MRDCPLYVLVVLMVGLTIMPAKFAVPLDGLKVTRPAAAGPPTATPHWLPEVAVKSLVLLPPSPPRVIAGPALVPAVPANMMFCSVLIPAVAWIVKAVDTPPDCALTICQLFWYAAPVQ